MKYLHPSFTVPVSGRDPEDCDHTRPWLDLKGCCVLCGTQLMDGDPREVYLRIADTMAQRCADRRGPH